MEGRRWLAITIVIVGALVSLSCVCLPGPRGAQVAQPTVEISEDAAKRLEEKAADLESGQFRVELSEEELTSYLALHLSDSVPLTSPQVRLLPGKIVLEGDITKPVRGHVSLSGTLRVAGGQVEVQIEDVRIGGLSLPRALLASVSDSITEAIGQGQEGVEIESVEILAGRVIITGRAR